jgi:two-component system response regulator RegA
MPAERILLVDDDQASRDPLARALRDRGFEVEVASHVGSARAAAMARTPAFALVDLTLPGGSGLDLVSQIHALNRGIRIFLLAGAETAMVRTEALRRGAVECLRKPIDADQVISAFAAGLPERKAVDGQP